MLDMQEVNQLLECWAGWILRKIDDGLGYAKESTIPPTNKPP